MSAVHWPPGLTDDTPLPFALWRVMDKVDGQVDGAELGRALNLTPQEVQQTLQETQRWVGRAAQRDQKVNPDSAREVTQCLTVVVGPVASLMVDELLDELGSKATMSALLSGLAEQLSPERWQQFARLLHDRGIA